jgi:ketosteroid isomerase-like protein
MKMHNRYGVIAAAISAATLLTPPATSAVAQGCSEQLAQDFLAGWTHDLPKLLSIFTDDAVYEDTAVHAVLHGKNELQAFAEGWFKAFPDLGFTLTSTIISGG